MTKCWRVVGTWCLCVTMYNRLISNKNSGNFSKFSYLNAGFYNPSINQIAFKHKLGFKLLFKLMFMKIFLNFKNVVF